MGVLGRIAARVHAAQVGADPEHRHAAKRAFDMVAAETRAFEHRHADDGDRMLAQGRGRRRIESIGAHHLHVHAEHAALHPVRDIGLAFPDVDDQITLIHCGVPCGA
ncbi:hypothetical protein D3C86_1817910 [compost metagenome]